MFHLISIVIPDVDIEEWKLFQPYTLPPHVDGTSCGMHAILNVWFLFNFGETYNQIDIRKARYWFANAVLNMKNEQIKKNKRELLKGRSIQIAKGKIIETIGKGDPFTLLKDLINERKESTCAGLTLGPNDIFTSSDSEDAVEYNEKISSPDENLIKFIMENGEYLRAVVDGSNKDPFEYSDRLKALKYFLQEELYRLQIKS